MLSLLGSPRPLLRRPDPPRDAEGRGPGRPRRRFTLPQLLAAEEAGTGAGRGKAKSVILLYLLGGAATQDMFDLKPERPGRGPRRVQADRHHRARASRSASTCRGRRGGCTRRPSSARSTTRPAATTACRATPASTSRCPTSTRATPIRRAWARCASTSRSGRTAADVARLRLHAVLARLGPGVPPRRPLRRLPRQAVRPAVHRVQPVSRTRTRPPAPGKPVHRPRRAAAARQRRSAPDITIDRLDTPAGLLQQIDDQLRAAERSRSAASSTGTQQRAFDLLTSSKVRAAFDLRTRRPADCATATAGRCSATAR